jgi:hypothetical protein
LKYRNTTSRLTRRVAKDPVDIVERIKNNFKLVMNIFSVFMKIWISDLSGQDWGVVHLNNRLNPNMNNITAIDHAVRDWIDDTDYLLGRNTAEYPRMSNTFKTKIDQQPWGSKSKPIYIEPFLDENQLQMSGGPAY